MSQAVAETDAPPVLETLENRVLTVTLNRPARKNAIGGGMIPLLREILQRAENNPAVGAILLTGSGATFCVGGDMNVLAGDGNKGDAMRESLLFSANTVLDLHRMSKPTIAFVRGAAAGGGLALALGCDLRYGDDSAKFTYAYTKIALAGDFALNYMLEKWLGATRAREFAFFCPVVTANEAVALGLLTRVFPAAEAEAQVRALAEQIANGPTGAIAEIKANLNAAAAGPVADAIAREAESFIRCRAKADHREAVQAFMEKRMPSFHHEP